MRPRATHITTCEGGDWLPFDTYNHFHWKYVHSIRFSDGSEWDCINGWRQDTLPKDNPEWTQSDAPPPGPTIPTSTPTPPPSESPTPTAGTSFSDEVGILLEALNLLRSLSPSSTWSLSVDMAQLNTTFEANRPTAATASGPSDLKFDMPPRAR